MSLISIGMLNQVFAPKKRYSDDLHQSDFPGFNQDRPFLTDEQRADINKQIAQ
jgi:hypothetical protein